MNTPDSILHLENGGNVGIGRENPLAKLHIGGNVRIDDVPMAALLGGLNYIVTILNLRTKGMSMTRLPLTMWAFWRIIISNY
ncbi:hypothetical protein N9Y89_02420 [bacterium]|nr:hypothetical protein [bacterium]